MIRRDVLRMASMEPNQGSNHHVPGMIPKHDDLSYLAVSMCVTDS